MSNRRVEGILRYAYNIRPGVREFNIINGIAYVDVFTPDGTEPGEVRFNGKLGLTEYANEIVMPRNHRGDTIRLELIWGNSVFEGDILELIEWVEDWDAGTSLDNASTRSKKIEDFSVTFEDAVESEERTSQRLNDLFGFYLRRITIVDVAEEQRDAGRYF